MAEDVPCQYLKMKMNSSLGVNLRVTGYCHQGGRKYMEDMFCVAYQQTEDGEDLEYAFFGIFDGHGGKEAAVFARERLMEFIVNEKKFWSDDDEDVLSAIRSGYIATHYAMWKDLANWPKTASGLPSTSGTTATIAFIRNGKIYVGHVGDSSLVLGYQSHPGPPHEHGWLAKPLTHDHKPESVNEIRRIQRSGGKVKSKSGVPRVVWNRPRIGHKGPVRRSTPIDEIPFLAVARSLGDLWSYNSDSNQFVVSPEPDVRVLKIDTSVHRCLIFGTDGFWNMVGPCEAVLVAQEAEKHNEATKAQLPPDDQQLCKNKWINPSKRLVERALYQWFSRGMRADNTSVVTLLLNPPCSQGMCQTQKIVSHTSGQVANPATADGLPLDAPRMSLDRPRSEESANRAVDGMELSKVDADADADLDASLRAEDRQRHSRQGLSSCCPLPGLLSPSVDQDDAPAENDSADEESASRTNLDKCSSWEGRGTEHAAATDRPVESAVTCKVTPETNKVAQSSAADDGVWLTDRPASPSPISNPMAASTPAVPRPPSNGLSYPTNSMHFNTASAKEKLVESLSRRGRIPSLKDVVNNAAGPSDKRQGLPLSSNVESGSLLRGVKRRHSSVLDQRNVVPEGRETKKRTRSEEKSLHQSPALSSTDITYNSEDTENERLAWPSDWLKKMRTCGEDDGSQENNVISFPPRRRKKWMRPAGSPLSGIRQARTLRSDTNAASQCRTLRSRNVDVRSSMKMQLSASKLTSKRTMALRAALTADLNSFASSSGLLQSPRGAVTSTRRKTRTVPTRSRV